MDSKISGMIREVMLQGFFLLMLLIVAYGNQGSEVFHQNNDLRNRLGSYLEVGSFSIIQACLSNLNYVKMVKV